MHSLLVHTLHAPVCHLVAYVGLAKSSEQYSFKHVHAKCKSAMYIVSRISPGVNVVIYLWRTTLSTQTFDFRFSENSWWKSYPTFAVCWMHSMLLYGRNCSSRDLPWRICGTVASMSNVSHVSVSCRWWSLLWETLCFWVSLCTTIFAQSLCAQVKKVQFSETVIIGC